jgi:HSP20 family protein
MAKKKTPQKQELQTRRQDLSPLETMSRMFDEFFSAGRPRFGLWNWPDPFPWEGGKAPAVDLVERDDEVLIRAELPGVEKDDLDVTMTETSVRIRAQSSHEHKDESGDVHRSEIFRGSFERTLPIPASVDADKAKATFRNGILELHLPKVAGTARRKLEVG